MKKLLLIALLLFPLLLWGQEGRTVISLNGEWSFDQTEQAFPPKKYTRKIPVPGLIHLATPRVSQYEKFFKKPTDPELTEQFNFLDRDYTPMYNWYKKNIFIDKQLQESELTLTIKKSQYTTHVYVNGILAGFSMECYTPIDINITEAIRFGQSNEILIMVGDRAWLPSEAAGSTDKEKINYLPGIWDDVFIAATGKIKVDKALFLPSLAKKQITVKTRLRSYYPPQMIYGTSMNDSCRIEIAVKEHNSGKLVATKTVRGIAKRDNMSYLETIIPLEKPEAWSPDSPFLYTGEINVYEKDNLTDSYSVRFGMRDFAAQGKSFTLNGEKIYLRGSNITLQRFFEDPDCGNLAWDREWVKKLLIDLPKSVNWNAMRICVGIVPDFWYDLCDEYGIMLQNEWFYWQNHGWDEQISKEYTNWVWSDGNHPSIVIWDALNENWDEYIGNTLIPKLKQLDHTRIWDAGYMTSEEMGTNDEMDEPHPYRALTLMHSSQLNEYFRNNPYNLGLLHNWDGFKHVMEAGVPQLVNEYGWIWLWRDGRPSKLTINNYNYYLGENAGPKECRELQAYWLQLETEWLRTERSLAGVLAFCHLTNNYGFTGDWFINNISDLEVSPAFKWFKHAFSPQAVFIDLADQRYTKHIPPCQPGGDLIFNLIAINDFNKKSNGKVKVRLLDSQGNQTIENQYDVSVSSYGKTILPVSLSLPEKSGCYTLVAEYTPENEAKKVLSRRYIRVGETESSTHFYELEP